MNDEKLERIKNECELAFRAERACRSVAGMSPMGDISAIEDSRVILLNLNGVLAIFDIVKRAGKKGLKWLEPTPQQLAYYKMGRGEHWEELLELARDAGDQGEAK